MRKSERIMLDARLVSMINSRAFHAELSNGHTFVAYTGNEAGDECERMKENDMVKVRMSPYDMSMGAIIEKPREEGC